MENLGDEYESPAVNNLQDILPINYQENWFWLKLIRITKLCNRNQISVRLFDLLTPLELKEYLQLILPVELYKRYQLEIKRWVSSKATISNVPVSPANYIKIKIQKQRYDIAVKLKNRQNRQSIKYLSIKYISNYLKYIRTQPLVMRKKIIKTTCDFLKKNLKMKLLSFYRKSLVRESLNLFFKLAASETGGSNRYFDPSSIVHISNTLLAEQHKKSLLKILDNNIIIKSQNTDYQLVIKTEPYKSQIDTLLATDLYKLYNSIIHQDLLETREEENRLLREQKQDAQYIGLKDSELEIPDYPISVNGYQCVSKCSRNNQPFLDSYYKQYNCACDTETYSKHFINYNWDWCQDKDCESN